MTTRILSIHIITFINKFHGGIVDVVSRLPEDTSNKELFIKAEFGLDKAARNPSFSYLLAIYDNNTIVIETIVLERIVPIGIRETGIVSEFVR